MRALLAGTGHRPLLDRVRSIFLCYALAMAALEVVFLLAASGGAERVLGMLALAALGAWWLRGWQRGSFPSWAEPFEWTVPLLAHELLGFDRFLPVLLGVLFYRGLYGDRRAALLRLVCGELILLLAALSTREISPAGLASLMIMVALLVLAMTLLRESLTEHEQAISRERAVAAGAARLAASSDRNVVHTTAVETTLAIASSAGASGVRVLLGLGHDLRHEVVAAAGFETSGAVGRTVQFDPLSPDLIATLRRGDPVYLEGADCEQLRKVTSLPPRKGGVMIVRLRAGGRDVGALSISSHRPLSPAVRATVASWSTQIATSLAGLALTEELLHRAYHDPLTGLANRDLMRERLGLALREATTGYTAFLLIDLDRFKQVNDTLGHRAGDDVLCAVADRLKAGIRPGDAVARLGGDEFGVVLPGVPDADTATTIAARLISTLQAPISADGRPVTIGGSIGVALRAAGSGATIDEIVQEADSAMYRAKAAGSGEYVLVDPPRLYAVS